MTSAGGLPRWAARHLTDEEARAVSAAVRDVETRTAAEIVPMVVRRSAAVDHVPWSLASLLLLAYVALDLSAELAGWHGPALWWRVAHVAALVLLALGASRLDAVRRWLVSPADRTRQVELRAEAEFHRARLHATEGRSGILLFVSVTEHRAVVLADDGISAKVPADAWEVIVAILVESARKRRLGAGLAEAVRAVGALVEPHVPVTHGRNELFDELIVKE